jgi:Leucine-rich repeat (LRR) protein
MKKALPRAIALLLITLLLAAALPILPAHAATDITAAFTDPAFLAVVRETLRLPSGSPVTDTQAATITQLDASGRGIASLAGIQYLTNLLVLDVSEKELIT